MAIDIAAERETGGVRIRRRAVRLTSRDRIAVTLPAAHADLVERHAEWIKSEVLAVSLDTDGVEQPQISKV